MSALARLWALRRERPVFVTVALVALAWFAAYPFVDLWLRAEGVAPTFRFWDFGAYGGALERWLDGEPIYIPAEGGGYHGRYLYPPAAIPVFAPFFTLLEFRGAAILFQVVSVLLLWTGLRRAAEACGLDLAGWERWGLLWLLLGFQPLLLGMKLGQTAALLGGLLSLSLALMLTAERTGWRSGGRSGSQSGGRSRGGGDDGWSLRGVASGALTGVVAAIKLPYAPAGAHLLRDRSRFVGAGLAVAGFVGVSVAVFGLEPNLRYLDVLRWGLSRGETGRSLVLWMPPLYRPLSWLPAATALRIVASLAIALGVVLAGPGADRESFALGVAAIPLLAPRTYVYYFVAALPAVVALLSVELDRRDGRPAVPVVAVVLLSVHAYGLMLLVDVLPTVVPAASALLPWAPLLQPGLWGNLLLVGLAGARVVQAGRLLERVPVSLCEGETESGVVGDGSSGD